MTALSEEELGLVPQGWEVRAIRDLCDIWSGGTPRKSEPAFWRGDIPWVSGKDLKSPQLEDGIDHISAEGLNAGSRLAPAGAVFVLVRGMGLAKDLPVATAKRPMAFNQDVKALVPRTGLSGLFLRSAIYHAKDRLLSRIVPSAHGTMTLNLDDVENLSILVPANPAEAEAIASVLDLVQRAISTEKHQLEVTIDFKRAAMRELFTRGLRGEAQRETEIGPAPESWEVVKLGSLGRVGNGSTPKKTIPEYWTGGTYPWLTSAKVYDREITAADQFVTTQALSECHLPRIKPGAVLIAITGQGKTLGHCAVLKIEATINQHIAYVATDTKRAEPSFIRGYLETQYDFLRQVGSAGGSTKGALTCAFLRELPIPFPSLDEQREIIAVLDTIDRKIDLHKRKRAVLEDLFKSLLHKLMTGEIRVEDLDLSAPSLFVEAEAAA
jgi:type I restriction enzyme S subunit